MTKTDPINICTKENPWTPQMRGRTQHPDAVDAGECSSGCCDYWKCPNCGTTFKTEVAE